MIACAVRKKILIFKKYKKFSVSIYSYINTSGNWKNEKLCAIRISQSAFRIYKCYIVCQISKTENRSFQFVDLSLLIFVTNIFIWRRSERKNMKNIPMQQNFAYYMIKFLHEKIPSFSDWLRAVQFLGNTVPKKEIQCQRRKFSANFFRF